MAELLSAIYALQRVIDNEEDLMSQPENTGVDHRQLGVDLFNRTWTLLENLERTSADDDELVHCAHASAYHWRHAPERRPENLARAEWMCSRVYAVLGRPEPAVHHARRCHEICEQHGIGDFDLAYAYEALARAHAVAGDAGSAREHGERAREAGRAIADDDDRELFESDLATLPV